MTLAVLLGALSGVGLWLCASALRPAPPPLHEALLTLDGMTGRTESGGPLTRAANQAADSEIGRALLQRSDADLRIIGRDRGTQLLRMAAGAAVAFLWAPATAALLSITGLDLAWQFPLWLSTLLTPLGALVPVVEARSAAQRRRESFRHAFGCFLDLVSVRLAGGAGVESALTSAARAGDGFVFAEIRLAINESRLRGEPAWDGLARLGAEIDVAELSELAASAVLAGDEGARVRTSINAKARSIRQRGLADAESAAQSASERMSLPVVLLMTGFIVFLGYPAVAQVITGL